jgi:hypothetical protein
MAYRVSKNVLWKLIDDEIVIIDTRKDDYSYLNSTGSEVWEMLVQGGALDTIIAELGRRYDGVNSASIREDVQGLLQNLLSNGLIEESDDGEARPAT